MHHSMFHIPVADTKIANAPLTTPAMLTALGVNAFVNAGGCRMFGTLECLYCPLADLIPRSDCNPPHDCPDCPKRSACPCGDDKLRRYLLSHP